MHRRSFLKLGAVGLALHVRGIPPFCLPSKPRIQRYVPLGNTGLQVSDVSFGGSRLSDASLVRYAYERGVTYFDTAESYRGGDSEIAMGQALSKVRDKVVIASKTKAWESNHRGHMMESLEKSLRRLKTDYVDIYYNHAVNDRSRHGKSRMGRIYGTCQKARKNQVSGHVRPWLKISAVFGVFHRPRIG